jgi:predicted dehydrogenase
MVQAARKYRRVFQVGSQQRSMWVNQKACEFLRAGGLGAISKVVYKNYASPWNMDLPVQPVPAGLDWNTWCGPVTPMPYHEDIYLPRANPGWISLEPFSGGDFTDWGAHGLDMVQSALGMDDSGPVEVWVEGDRFKPPTFKEPVKRGDAMKLCSAPRVFFRYANGVVLEPTEDSALSAFGGVFHAEKGKLVLGRGRIESDPEEIALDLTRQRPRHRDESHIQNWLDCIKTRARPNADVEIGHRSTTVCHLGNIARYTGRKLRWDPVKEEFVGDQEANALLDRERRKPWTLPEKV